MGYGNIMRVEITGGGRSHQMAQDDSGSMAQYKPMIQRVGNSCGVDPALIAGIISRESSAGVTLDVNHCGDNGNGFGLMQVDKRYHTIRGAWNSEEHLRQATGILIHFINCMQQKFPNWTREQQLRGGVAAYNAGDRMVRSYDAVDAGTTHQNYSNDVVARAQWYKGNGY